MEDGLSVRDAEALVREGYVEPRDTQANPKEKSKSSADISDKQFVFKEHLSDKLSAKIEIKKSNGGNGKIIVNFNSEVDLNRIIQLLNK